MAESRRMPGWMVLLLVAVLVAAAGFVIVYGARR